MAMSSADRKRKQRERAALGAVSAEVIRNQLLFTVRCKVDFFCRDTTRTEPTVMDIAHEIANLYPADQQSRVLAYLGYPTDEPEHNGYS